MTDLEEEEPLEVRSTTTSSDSYTTNDPSNTEG